MAFVWHSSFNRLNAWRQHRSDGGEHGTRERSRGAPGRNPRRRDSRALERGNQRHYDTEDRGSHRHQSGDALYHVGSKDELLLAVLREMMRLTGEVARRVLTAGLSPRAAIRHSITAFWQHVEATPELQVMQYELTLYALRHGGSAWLAREQYAGYGAVVEELLHETFTAAGARCALPFPALARFIVGGLDGLILQFISDRDSVRARRDLETLIAAVIALAEGTAPSLGAEESVGTQAQRA
jgi:AcrR family transcriptional regulator